MQIFKHIPTGKYVAVKTIDGVPFYSKLYNSPYEIMQNICPEWAEAYMIKCTTKLQKILG